MRVITEDDVLSKENLLLDIKAAAKVLSVSPTTLNNWRHKGIGPTYIKMSKNYIRYRQKDLEDFLIISTRRSTSDPGQQDAV